MTSTPKPIVIISFDHTCDRRSNEIVFDALTKADIRPTFYIQTGLIGSRHWRATVADIQPLYDQGWDFGSHSVTHPRMSELTPEQIEYEIRTADMFLADNKFVKGRRHFSYPQARTDDKVIGILKKYCDTGRIVTGELGKINPTGDDWYKLDCLSMKAGQPTTRATDLVDQAIEKELVAHIMFEAIFPEDPPEQAYLESDFRKIVDYIKNKRDLGEIQTMTVSEFFDSSNIK
ncbi:polysaccharide deacetylase family protein [Polynucleobacter sp. JS-Safj-400b-B2]|uniref:polysaccharide deacetylase family protein n=1 Tax=Polynucleobacter sp. JS-Safj-400b-B2 TaxID=2576921 RepID=UPI001C0AD14B|nr:polysaccharide deacetylase family protein [Polynucleobacter sp. JS-Safj-400b-B2]MBU3626728.1 polysaccharide deacetylase family protein [Polynucleobacter sp. JS-Safj-400b-B2]